MKASISRVWLPRTEFLSYFNVSASWIVSSGYDVSAYVNSQKLWLLAQELHEIKWVNPSMHGGGDIEASHLVENLSAIDGCWVGGVSSGRLSMVQWVITHQYASEKQYLDSLSYYFEKNLDMMLGGSCVMSSHGELEVKNGRLKQSRYVGCMVEISKE